MTSRLNSRRITTPKIREITFFVPVFVNIISSVRGFFITSTITIFYYKYTYNNNNEHNNNNNISNNNNDNKRDKLTTTNNIHHVKIQPCSIYSFFNRGTYVASSFENWLQSIAPLNLKLLFRNALFGSCQFSILI